MSRRSTTCRVVNLSTVKLMEFGGAATVKAWHQRLEDAEVATAAARAQLREVPCLIKRIHQERTENACQAERHRHRQNPYHIEMTWLGCKASEMQEKLLLQSSERVQELLDEPLGVSDRKPSACFFSKITKNQKLRHKEKDWNGLKRVQICQSLIECQIFACNVHLRSFEGQAVFCLFTFHSF